MNRDDIIRMAREAGFEGLLPSEHVNGLGAIYSGDEEITEIVERFYALAVAAEREACERLAWDTPDDEETGIRTAIALAIRERGEK